MLWMIRMRRLFKTAGREAMVLWYAFRNPATPFGIKAGVVLMMLYLISPFDLLPDFALLFGLVDDLAVFAIGIPFLVSKLPPEVRAESTSRAERLFARFGWASRADHQG